MRSTTLLLALLTVPFFPFAAQAQSADTGMVILNDTAPSVQHEGRAQAAWGTTSASVVTLEASGFVPAASGASYFFSAAGGYLTRTGGTEFFDQQVSLPSGSEIAVMELESCDQDPLARVDAYLFVTNVLAGASSTPISAGTTDAGIPGCSFALGTPVTPVPIDNFTQRYRVRVAIRGATHDTRLGAVRLYYRLKVSPAPAVASFGDVPVGSPLHQFIEAVAGAGITAGCGGGNFCPNDPITRGQMAVFLAKALGLHWPN